MNHEVHSPSFRLQNPRITSTTSTSHANATVVQHPSSTEQCAVPCPRFLLPPHMTKLLPFNTPGAPPPLNIFHRLRLIPPPASVRANTARRPLVRRGCVRGSKLRISSPHFQVRITAPRQLRSKSPTYRVLFLPWPRPSLVCGALAQFLHRTHGTHAYAAPSPITHRA